MNERNLTEFDHRTDFYWVRSSIVETQKLVNENNKSSNDQTKALICC
jgi:hypothetical protein